MGIRAAFRVRLIFLATVCASVQGAPSVEESRIVNGEEATPHAWPWQISLLTNTTGDQWYHTCSGSLIDARWVMTAAHCYRANARYLVWLGKQQLNVTEAGQIFSEIRQFIRHPVWDINYPQRGFDIALIELSSPVTLSKTVQVALLPGAGWLLPNGKLCDATGWGKLSTNGPISETLQQAVLPVVSNDICSRNDWWGADIKSNMVCAGDASHSICQGDSGGPLNCMTNEQWMVYGISSFISSVCGVANKPSVFTRVSAFKNWISNVTDVQFPNDETTTTVSPGMNAQTQHKTTLENASSVPTAEASLLLQMLLLPLMVVMMVGSS